MTPVRCKMMCTEVVHLLNDRKTYKFVPQYSDVEGSENKKFWEYAPDGSMEFNYAKGDLEFEVGKEYYVDISPSAIEEVAK